MIEEIREVMVDETDASGRMNRLVDKFRRGRDTSEIAQALDSDESEIVSLAAWILGELPFDLYCTDPLLARLRRLTSHNDWQVRFHALMALFPALRAGEPATDAILGELLRDPNESVRTTAQHARDRLLGRELDRRSR